MICGDLADWGLLSGFKYVAETWEKVFPHGKGAGGRPVQKLFCTGNHDYEGWWYGDMTAEMHALGYDEDEALKSDLLPIAGNVSLLTREVVHINPETGELADPNCAAAKLWMPKYEPGWELKS